MSFAEDDLVAASVTDILRRHIRLVEIERCQDLAYGKGSARMPCLDAVQSFNQIASEFQTERIQLLFLFVGHFESLLFLDRF